MVEYNIKNKLLEQVREMVSEVDEEILLKTNLYELNIDSLSIMKILSFWMKQGFKIKFNDLMKNPYIEKWVDIIENAPRKMSTEKKEKPSDTREKITDKTPFDLTDVQYAYWMGRKETQYMGGVGCHGYMEVKCQSIDEAKLNEAFNVVKMSHPMLRACYTEDGKQYVMDKPFSDTIKIEDISSLNEKDQEIYLMEKREKLSHRLLRISEGEVVEIELTKRSDKDYIFHFDIDLLVCDVFSFKIILRDLAHYYMTGEKPDTDTSWSFADYLYRKNIEQRDAFEEDKQYWAQKLEVLPMGPNLPMKSGIKNVKCPKFTRHHKKFEKQVWDEIKQIAVSNKMTSAMILLTAYARTIGRWSDNKKFLLNLPIFNRDSTEEFSNKVADFTNIVLVESDMSQTRNFMEDARLLHDSFMKNASHLAYSGIKVLRDLYKYREEDIKAPVVFSCNLGAPLLSEEFEQAFGRLDYMISQTPQVWIDFQAFDEDGGLYILWDSVDEIFPDGLLDEMFDYFKQELVGIISEKTKGENIVYSAGERARIDEWNQVKKFQCKDENLHEKIFNQAKTHADDVAVINADTGVEMTYKELTKKALAIAASLKKEKKGRLVALFLPRGERQITAALGVLAAGMAYIPIQITQPKDRLSYMLQSSDISGIITEKQYVNLLPDVKKDIYEFSEFSEVTPLNQPVIVNNKEVAYVIYTSGTTGIPKGVMVSHKAALNTIIEVNNLTGLTSTDTVLNVSSYDFDLSVYDFFGLLREGGRLVVLTQDSWRDAKAWSDALHKYNVTIWNSVPIQFKMLLLETEMDLDLVASLRYVYLSGDWIDIDIPKQLYAINPKTKILAMGGATEAGIWSNYIEVHKEINPQWKSIPYGRPLKGQYYRVVDVVGRDTPCYAIGELWIGGLGVAEGYLGDEKLTKEKFIEDETGRWYRTGDMGRFWYDGTIEFLGREDNQIKLRGHRIELGEIEKVIEDTGYVERSKVSVIRENEKQALVVYAKPLEQGIGNQISKINFHQEFEEEVDEEFLSEIIDRIHFENEQNRQFTKSMLGKWLERIKNIHPIYQYESLIAKWKSLMSGQDIKKVELDEQKQNLLEKFVNVYDKNLVDILEGKKTTKDLVLDSDYVDVSNVLNNSAHTDLANHYMGAALKKMKSDENPIKILEIGCDDVERTKVYQNSFANCEYTVCVESLVYKEQLDDVISCDVKVLNLDEPLYTEEDGFDLIISNQSLHRCKNLPVALENIRRLLKENGCFIFTELLQLLDIGLISTVFLRKQYEDLRKDSLHMLLDDNEWENLIKESKFTSIAHATDRDKSIGYFVLRNENPHIFVDGKIELKKLLSVKLPEYMIPKYYVFLQDFPITANGKVDHKALGKIAPDIVDHMSDREFKSETEKKLACIWTEILKEIPNISDNFFVLGGDSLLATNLRNKICEVFQIEIPFEMIYKAAVLSEMAEVIDSMKENSVSKESLIRIKDDNPYEPFPLTDIQQSYMIGRSGDYELGNVSSHCYFEMDVGPIDTVRMEEALNKLIELHPMLRAVICEDNIHQRILEKTEYYHIDRKDLSDLTDSQKEECLLKERDEMGHQTLNPYQWPAYDFRYCKLDESHGRILISFDNVFFDGWSMFYIFRQWKQLYANIDLKLKKADMTFKEYVLSCAATDTENQAAVDSDLEYWNQKLPYIYPSPDINVKRNTQNDSFVRYQLGLTATKWENLKQKIRSVGLTAPTFLMSLYAEVLASFSRKQQFSLNITRFKRCPFSENINDIVGDFTTLTILSLDRSEGNNFLERTRNLQTTLWSDISHDHIDGVEVERMLNRGKVNGVTMPIVFTSGIGLMEDRTIEDNSYLGEIGYGLSQTPQVWMDMQVYDDKNGLSVSMDAMKEIFPSGMLDEFWDSYNKLLEEFVNDETSWTKNTGNLTHPGNEKLVVSLNDTKRNIQASTLLNGFYENIKIHPNNVAIYYKDRLITYGQLFGYSYELAQRLIKNGFEGKEPVGILMPKGPEQVIAAIGILMAGGTYLPFSVKHPISRNGKIINSSGTKFLVCNKDCKEYKKYANCIFYHEALKGNQEVKDVVQAIEKLPKINPTDIAYIIYTSGTTGDPKGVAISHKAAMNTIKDINDILKTDKNDVVICLSQMNFDLSVYDIFGMISVGGKMVIPEEEHALDFVYWDKLIEKYGVSIWNSVPSYMVMYLNYKESVATTNPSLRAILLSGDWIPVDIKQYGKKVATNATFYGLGGATECAIWSNIHKIEDQDSTRNSIPYGRPLANQRMYVLNDYLESVRNNVVGNLYISGDSLAQGYWKNEVLTRESFIFHPNTGERLYKTGDLAMYSDEGFIVFIGRDDGQVKLNGYRIETGEVESAIKRFDKDIMAVVLIKDNQLHAFVDKEVDRDQLREDLKKQLPEYMIPTYIHIVDEIPLSTNGKVNRKYLESICVNESYGESKVPLSTEWEKRVSVLWQEIFNVRDVYANDSFFKLGGDSLKAVIFVNELKNKYFIELLLKHVLEKPTVSEIAKEIEKLDIDFEEGEI